MKNKLQFFLLAWLLPFAGGAATWFVRPGVQSAWNQSSPAHPVPTPGVYGAQNGTNWANAWNGLESIVWGAGGVRAGDILYICGTHIYEVKEWNYPIYQANITIPPAGSGCTIRMDYVPDPGLIFGGAFERTHSYPWEGPDPNGVYRCTNHYYFPYQLCWQIDGTNITRLNTTNVTTWTGGLGTWACVGNSNYLKTTTGAAPGTNIAVNAFGWGFTLPAGVSNVVFASCKFIGGGFLIDYPTYPSGKVPLNYLAHHITFRNCQFTDCDMNQTSRSIMFPLSPGNDYWTFDGCEVGYGPAAIYSGVGYQSGTNQNRGIIGLVVTNCYLHDLDTANYPTVDGHAIGAQDNSDCVLVGNRIERTGCAIALFSFGYGMTNNLIGWNFVKDIHWHNQNGDTGGEGIWLSASVPNVAISNRIVGNIVLNTGLPGPGPYASYMGSGIASSMPDPVEILNNVVMNANQGINISINNYSPQARILNNLIVNATNMLIHVGNQANGTVTCDYNLFYTNASLSTPFYFAGGLAHDAHSVFANPRFVSATPSSPKDFRLTQSSKAIGAGISVGLLRDFSGVLIPSNAPPDIGAFRFALSGNILTAPSGLHVEQ